ncbi:hypothetical protein CIG75_03875 [Tumebacillus algifaecis]|uniref:Guanylate cyclase domain-containing protein n=1 Tax=Tumebacillus algifaecis TaxID=1214604 RepID=A0A223CXU8_9BACL|nr:hypothetical protein [Tumebacillus algifaecis]ASS74209.1 hypothetical protein CIG75_03875 [Tumebacillus algifaecis]
MRENPDFGPKNVYVAFLDILGFSEALMANKIEDIEKLYRTIEQVFIVDNSKAMNRNKEGILDAFGKIGLDHLLNEFEDSSIDAHSVSDSLFLWTSDDSALSFQQLTHYVNRLLTQFLIYGFPARAAITYGEVAVRTVKTGFHPQRNVFGRGIAKAHTLEGLQVWSGAIVDDVALSHVLLRKSFGETMVNSLYREKFLVEYEVPMKKGEVKSYTALNWTVNFNKNEFGKMGRGIVEKFTDHNKKIDDWSVRVKIDNTVKFFNDMKTRQR